MSAAAVRDERAAFAEALGVPRETLSQLDIYATLLGRWQGRINLVGRSTLDRIWTRHFLDSGQLVPLVAAHRPGGLPARWLDLGSGAGFPGLVLALLGAGEVHLVESGARKCAFLRTVIRETGAQAQVHACRIEAMDEIPADIVTARALAPLDRLLDYAAEFLARGAEGWFLKGRGWEEELTRCRQSGKVEGREITSYPSRTDPQAVVLRVRSHARA